MAQDQTGKPQGRWRVFHEKFVVEERFMSAPARRNLYRTAVVADDRGRRAVHLSSWPSVLQHGGISAADEPVRSWLLTLRAEPTTIIMIILAIIFGPIGLPIIVLVGDGGLGPAGQARLAADAPGRRHADRRHPGADHRPHRRTPPASGGPHALRRRLHVLVSVRPRPGRVRLPAGHHVPGLFAPEEPHGRRRRLHGGGNRHLLRRRQPAVPRLPLDDRCPRSPCRSRW